jgi:hypothetical protein
MKIFQVNYTDGRKYRVAVSDTTKSIKRLVNSANKKGEVKEIEQLTVGINTLRDFEKL